MRNRAPLTLMEIMLLMLVFSVAAAVCMRVFVKSNEISRQNEARDQAVIITQSAAELIRHSGGDLTTAADELGGQAEGDTLTVKYGSAGEYTLHAKRIPSDIGGLGKAQVWASDADGQELYSLCVMWQEENTYE